MKNLLKLFLITIFLISCGHQVTRKEINKELSLEQNMLILKSLKEDAIASNAALYAPIEFNEGTELYNEVKERINDGETLGIYEPMGYSMAYFEEAQKMAEIRRNRHQEIDKMREKSLAAGAQEYEKIKEDLKEIDGFLKSEFASRDYVLSKDKEKNILSDYRQIYKRSRVYAELGDTIETIKLLEKRNADDIAPISYENLIGSLETAKNAIKENPEDANSYQADIVVVNARTINLYEIINIAKDINGEVSEDALIKIWKKNRKIDRLRIDKESLRWEIAVALDSLNYTQKQINGKNEKINHLKKKAQISLTAKNLREEIGREKADVLIEEQNIVIKLKDMPYDLNEVDIPSDSLTVLEDISKVIKMVNPSQVTVIGHSDTIGGQTVNMKVSKARAHKVEKYLERKIDDTSVDSLAYAYSKPLRPNIDPETRAINRRVDIVIKL